jgi:hypothetical protein
MISMETRLVLLADTATRNGWAVTTETVQTRTGSPLVQLTASRNGQWVLVTGDSSRSRRGSFSARTWAIENPHMRKVTQTTASLMLSAA